MIYIFFWIVIGMVIVYLYRNHLHETFGPDHVIVRVIGVAFLLLWPLVLAVDILSRIVGFIIGKPNV